MMATNCTFQEVDNIFCFAVGIAVHDEFFSCMCAAALLCAFDVLARHTIIDHNPTWDDKSRQERKSFGIRKPKNYHRMESMRKSNILSHSVEYIHWAN
jgi:hypothetical protein